MSRHLAVISAVAICMALSQVAFAGETYSREEAVNIALEKSSDVKSAEEELVSANSKVESGYGNAYPTIDLNARITRIFGLDDVKSSSTMADEAKKMFDDNKANDFDVNITGPALDGMMYGLKSQGFRWQSTVGITATQVLYAQGKVSTGIEVAKVYKNLKEVNLDNTKSNVRFDVESAFDKLIYLDSALVILEESIAQLQSHLEYVNQALASGLATELDQVRAQLQLDELKSEVENTKKNQVLARNSLLNTMGLDWQSDVKFQGDLRSPESNLPYPDTAMANVKKRRKELVMLDASEQMQLKNISIEEGGYKPTLALIGGIEYSNNKNHFYQWSAPDWDDNINKYIALNFSMNLFNGMQTKEAVVQAKSDLRSVQIQKESAERGYRVQIESCANTLADAENQLEIQKGQVNLATRNYDLTEASYKIGKSTQLDFLDATMTLRNTKLKYMEAVLNWNNAYNALLQATGEY